MTNRRREELEARAAVLEAEAAGLRNELERLESDQQPVRPYVQLSGRDGNVFAIIGRVSQALNESGQVERAAEFRARAMSGDYDYDGIIGALVHEYVEVG